MRKCATLILIASISFLSLVSCDGGGGNGEGEFTVFDVNINPDTACTSEMPGNELKLSLLVSGRNMTGTGELLAYGNVGETEKVKGRTENDNFAIKPFEVRVSSDPIVENAMDAGLSSISYSFDEFVGEFIDDDMDELVDGIEGSFIASLTVINEGESTFCEAITGEIIGIARSPEGCTSPREGPTLECPAEGFVNQCDAYNYHFCYGWCEADLCFDTYYNARECEIIDCLTVSCNTLPGLIDLEGREIFGGFRLYVDDTHYIGCN